MDHNWKIYDLKRVIDNGVVTEITYACESQLSGSGTRKIGNLTVVGSSDDDGFISYDNLTQTDVLGWVYASVDKTIFETENSSSIAQQITRRAAITTKTGTPW
mgnify:FL=1|tara:strand:+ start:270 stop:578 length:309 start_codon:yes stop_codon:yes gene_type:complete